MKQCNPATALHRATHRVAAAAAGSKGRNHAFIENEWTIRRHRADIGISSKSGGGIDRDRHVGGPEIGIRNPDDIAAIDHNPTAEGVRATKRENPRPILHKGQHPRPVVSDWCADNHRAVRGRAPEGIAANRHMKIAGSRRRQGDGPGTSDHLLPGSASAAQDA